MKLVCVSPFILYLFMQGDALRAHSSLPSEATKQANRTDLLFRLEHLVQLSTEICLYAPSNGLPKDFIVSLMVLLMAQLQETHPLLTRTFCQAKLMALSLRHLDQSVPLEDKLHMVTRLHQQQASWSRSFQQHAMYYSSEDQVLLHRLLVAKFSNEYRRRGRSSHSSDDDTDDDEGDGGEGEADEDSHQAEGKLPLLMEALSVAAAIEKKGKTSLEEELKLVKKYQSQCHSSRLSFIRRNEMFMARVLRGHEEKINAITTMAINATAFTMAAQNALRKEHLISLRDQMAMDIIAKQKLTGLVERFTHEKAPFAKAIADCSWQHDEIEGTGRMRKRFCRAKRRLHPKFYKDPPMTLLPPCSSIESEKPFANILKPLKPMSSDLAEILLHQLSQHESTSVKVMEQCWLVIPQGEVCTVLIIFKNLSNNLQ